MTIDALFDEEDAMISVASEIVKNQAFSDNPLFPHFSRLLCSYTKLNKQQKRIIRLSDKQHHKLSVVNRAMRHILDNIPVGIIVVDRDWKINPSYSQHMHQLFRGAGKIAGASIDHLLFWEENRDKERASLRKWLALVFDLAYDWELVGELGPDVIEHPADGGTLYLRNSYHRIIHDNGELYLMIYITDITERVRQKIALKEQETARHFELEMFSFVMNQESSGDVIDFLNDTERMIRESLELYGKLEQSTGREGLYHHMFRLMHSVKGLARTCGVNEFARLAHQAEDILNKYRTHEISFETGMVEGVLASETLLKILNHMRDLLGSGEKILDRVFSQGRENAACIRNRRRGISVDREKILSMLAALENMKQHTSGAEPVSGQIDAMAEQMFRMVLQPLDVVYNRLHRIVNDLARSLGKEAELAVEGELLMLGPEAHYLVINALIHLLRNAVDHGIEMPGKRSELGKNPKGKVFIRTSADADRFRIDISDDGAGIDPCVIVARAVAKRFVTQEAVASMNDEEKLALILLPGFSSRDSVSDISGRGVGMDVVAEAMKTFGGSLSIGSVLNGGTTLVLEFPAPRRGMKTPF